MVTSFQRTVYDALTCVPMGQVTTYGLLAAQVGCGSPQAVGQALKCNPYAPDVPCHRVISSNLCIGGFNGASRGPEIERKERLLAEEGVMFAPDGTLIEQTRVHSFDL